MPPAPRALIVTNSRARGSLAAARALGQGGWDVGVGTPDDGGMVAASRWVRRQHHVPRPRGDARVFADAVAAAVDTAGYDVVFGGGDDWIAALSVHRDGVPATVALPPDEAVRAALDKLGLVRRARAVGLSAPHTELATEATMAAWPGRVVVKCRRHWFPGQRQRLRIEARGFRDVATAAPHVDFLQRAGFEAVLQQPVDGRLGALVGLAHEGRLVGRVQQTSHGLWPTPSGVSSRAVSEPIDEDFAKKAAALVSDVGWSGLVELQYLTPTGGPRHVIDFNGRFFGSMALTLAAGPNLPDAWGRQALGLPIGDLPDGRPGVRYQWVAGDLRRAVAERRGGLVRDLATSLAWPMRGETAPSVLQPHDLGPARLLLAARLQRGLSDDD